MRNSLIIAKYTFQEIFQSKLMINIFFLGLGIFLFAFVSAEFTFGNPAKIALDVGLGAMSISAAALAILVGSNLVSKEVDSRTVYMILSRPVKRYDFLMGRILGLVTFLFTNTLILFLFTLVVFSLYGGELNRLMFWASVFIFVESIILLAISILFSLLTNTALTVFFSVMVFGAGHWIAEVQNTYYAKINPSFMWAAKVFAWFVPDLDKLNIKKFAFYDVSLTTGYLAKTFAYGLGFFLVVLLLSNVIFYKKSLD